MKIIELDLTGVKTLNKLHERIRLAFDFPEWYGANWDALLDLLGGEWDADKVIVKGGSSLSNVFKDHLEKMHKILERKIKFNNTWKLILKISSRKYSNL